MTSSPAYKILNFDECKEILSGIGKELENFDDQLNTNNAFVYYLKGDKVLLISGELNQNSQGIFYNNYLQFRKHLNQDNFPIKNKISRVEELYQNEILKLGESSTFLEDFFINKFNDEFNKRDLKSLIILAERIKGSRSELTKDEMFLSYLFIGDLIRKSINGRWVFLKKYGQFNSFQVPAILLDNHNVYLFLENVDMFFISDFNFEKYKDDSLANYPELPLSGNFIKNNYSSYIIN